MIAEAIARLRDRRIHVVGLSGTEGAAVAQFLLEYGVTSITAHDLQTAEGFPAAFRRYHGWMDPAAQEAAIRRLLGGPIQLRFRDRYLEDIARAEVIYAGQAWFRHPENAPVARARDAGTPLSSMTELFFETVPCPILGVTGTNGKFTVVQLAAEMLAESGRRTFVSGNDRTHVPILYRLRDVSRDAILVLEISNRQLVGLRYSPQIAVITNLAPHHLDDHGSFEGYVRVKSGILAHQGTSDRAILNADDPPTWGLAAMARGAVVPFSRLRDVDEGACIVAGRITVRLGGREDRLCDVSELAVPGTHMVENALAAALAARCAGASPEAVASVLRAFRGLPYRMRFVAEVSGVRFYEDSLATNPAAAAAAIRAFDRPLVLIAGGQRPGGTADDFRPMARALADRPVRAVLLIGAMAPQLEAAVAAVGLGSQVAQCGALAAAVQRACEVARPGDVVTLSPGCESFDQFRDYRERGDRYRDLVAALAERAAGAAGGSGRWT
ncbi:MAG: UDP-N-acetylmuramoyl-L-alanine--D-glutamate ligase [Bacillati bacterium ANGP1]|uniref:UDP-N-acetylmuramoylalanine--D-glutamate ligase n=1 Tax=Candidatus Segetimicrobium genomatis TaxID=2569760 RepID=A0A537M9N5_9BACT|nr:MAG: UDP-N-acetylmuramoyl-L-alanine--D-glutamate ligase [Terrabacteria group bacterium ANGP1]